MTEITLETEDDLEKVTNFYRGSLPTRSTQIFAIDNPEGKTISITTELPDQSSTNILLTPGAQGTGTHIQITHMGSDEPTTIPGGD